MSFFSKIIAKSLTFFGAMAASFFSGRRRERDKQKVARLEEANEAQATRKEIDDEIREDDDLLERARRVGIVRYDE